MTAALINIGWMLLGAFLLFIGLAVYAVSRKPVAQQPQAGAGGENAKVKVGEDVVCVLNREPNDADSKLTAWSFKSGLRKRKRFV